MGCCFGATKTRVKLVTGYDSSGPDQRYVVEQQRELVGKLVWTRLHRAERKFEEEAAAALADRFETDAADVKRKAGKGVSSNLTSVVLSFLPDEALLAFFTFPVTPKEESQGGVCCSAFAAEPGKGHVSLEVGDSVRVLGRGQSAGGSAWVMVQTGTGSAGLVPERCILGGGDGDPTVPVTEPAPTLPGGAVEYTAAAGQVLRFVPEQGGIGLFVNGAREQTLVDLRFDQETAAMTAASGWRLQLTAADSGGLVQDVAKLATDAGLEHGLAVPEPDSEGLRLPDHPPPDPPAQAEAADDVEAATAAPREAAAAADSDAPDAAAGQEAAPAAVPEPVVVHEHLVAPTAVPLPDSPGPADAEQRADSPRGLDAASPGTKRVSDAAACALPASPHDGVELMMDEDSSGDKNSGASDPAVQRDPQPAPATDGPSGAGEEVAAAAAQPVNDAKVREPAAGGDEGQQKRKKGRKKKGKQQEASGDWEAEDCAQPTGSGRKKKKKRPADVVGSPDAASPTPADP